MPWQRHCWQFWWPRSCWRAVSRRARRLSTAGPGDRRSGGQFHPAGLDEEGRTGPRAGAVRHPAAAVWSAGLESGYVNMRRNAPLDRLCWLSGCRWPPRSRSGSWRYHGARFHAGRCAGAGRHRGAAGRRAGDGRGRRLGLPRRIMTLLGGESLLNDATALTAYKVGVGRRDRPRRRRGCRARHASSWPRAGGAVVRCARRVGHHHSSDPGWTTRWWRAPSGWWRRSSSICWPRRYMPPACVAVVVAALMLGQRSTHAGYATRLQDGALWKALQLILGRSPSC